MTFDDVAGLEQRITHFDVKGLGPLAPPDRATVEDRQHDHRHAPQSRVKGNDGGFAASRDLVLQLRIMNDAIDTDGGARIVPTRWSGCAPGAKAILDDFDGLGLGSAPLTAASVVAVPPGAT